jgi:hypothetical protein
MRDIATLVWVVLILIGVISSMVASVRRRMNALPPRGAPLASPAPPGVPPSQAPPLQAQLRQQLVQQMKQVPVRPAAPATPPASAPRPAAVRAPALRRFFPGRQGLVGAVIAAEVLGKPRALSDEYLHP